MVKPSAKLTPEQKNFIDKHLKEFTSRQLSKKLNISRQIIEEYIDAKRSADLPAEPGTKKLALLLVAAICLVFSNTLFNGFVWDDDNYILQDPMLESVANLPQTVMKPLGYHGSPDKRGSLWRPVMTVTLFLDHALWGKKAFGYHLTNILLHALAVLALFFLAKRLSLDARLAFWAALLYGLHPVMSEAVASANARHSPLSGLFIFTALLFYRKKPFLSWGAFFLALYSKETAVVFPLALIVYEWVRGGGLKDFLKIIPYIALSGFYLASRFYVLGGIGEAWIGDPLPLGERIFMQPFLIFEYLKMIFIPVHLHMWRQPAVPAAFFTGEYLLALITCAFAAFAVFKLRKNNPLIIWSALWFIIFLIPVLNLFIMVNSLILEHWLYIPLAGMMLLIFFVLKKYFYADKDSVKKCTAILSVVAVCFAALTVMQNTTWKDDTTLFRHTLKYVKKDPAIYTNLGTSLAMKGRLDEAEEAFNEALKVDPGYAYAKLNLASVKRQKLSGAAARVTTVQDQ